MTSRLIRINCIKSKQVSEPGKIEISTKLIEGRFCRAIRLLSYSVTGNSGAAKTHLLLALTGLGSDSEYTMVSGGPMEPKLHEERSTKFVLYPPGGLRTQSRTSPWITIPQGSTKSVNGLKLELQTFNGQDYERYDDFTELVLEIEIDSYEGSAAMRNHVIRN